MKLTKRQQELLKVLELNEVVDVATSPNFRRIMKSDPAATTSKQTLLGLQARGIIKIYMSSYLGATIELVMDINGVTSAGQDNTSAKRQKSRRDRLNDVAQAKGYDTWSKYETAVLRGEDILFSMRTIKNTAMIDGEELVYDLAAQNRDSYQDMENNRPIEYIGFGVFHKHNEVQQLGITKSHFWKRVKQD